MSKTQVKGSDVKVKRSTSKAKIDDSKGLKKVDSKIKKDDSPKLHKDDSKLHKDDSKLHKEDSKPHKDDSKIKKDDSKAKKEETKGKSDTKLKDPKSKEKSNPGSPVAVKNKASGRSQTQLNKVESTKVLTEPQDHELSESITPSPSHSEKHLELDKELAAHEGIEPEHVMEDNAETRKKTPTGSDVAENKSIKDKDVSVSPIDRPSEEEHDMKKIGSRTKYEEDHTSDEGSVKRHRARSQSRQDIKDKAGKTDDAEECDYKKKRNADSADSAHKKDKPARSKTKQNHEAAESDANKKERYRPPEREYKKDKNWECDKKADKSKTEDSDSNNEESRKTKDGDYKKARDWDSQDHEYEKPWQTKADEPQTCNFKKKSWRSPCKCKKEKSWEDEKDDYKNAYLFWKNRDRTDYRSHKQEQSSSTYNTFNEDASRPTFRKFRCPIPTDTKKERPTCQCTSCRPKYKERPCCLDSKEKQPEKYSQMSKELDYRPQAKQTYQFAEKPERKPCYVRHAAVSPTKTCSGVASCCHRPRPFPDPQSCCPCKKCCGHNTYSASRNRIPPCTNAGYLGCPAQSKFYRAPVQLAERTCYAPMECLPRRLSCTVARPTSCPVKANEFCNNRSELTRTCEYTSDRCAFNKCPSTSPVNSCGSSWDRMQPRRPSVNRNFGLSPQPKSCMDFATNLIDVCGCVHSRSQQLLSNPKKTDSFSNSMSIKSELASRSRPRKEMHLSFGEARDLTPSPNGFSSMPRSRITSNIASKSDQLSGSLVMQSGSSAHPTKVSLVSGSHSFNSKLNSRTRNCKSASGPVERGRAAQSNSYHPKRYSSLNRDSRDNAFEVGASDRSLTDRDFYSSLASHSELKSISSNSPCGSYGL